jgi:hypothetical protein
MAGDGVGDGVGDGDNDAINAGLVDSSACSKRKTAEA